MTTYLTADLSDTDNATWLAQLPELHGNGHTVDITGSRVTLTQATLDVLADLSDERDGHYDGSLLWIDGTGYTVSPLGRSILDLAQDVAAQRNIETTAAVEVVTTYVDQISDDTSMWCAETSTLTEAGERVVVTAIEAGYDNNLHSTAEDLMLDELEQVPAKLRALHVQEAQLIGERDDLVRKLMKTSVARPRIAEAAELSVDRLYQIKDHRR